MPHLLPTGQEVDRRRRLPEHPPSHVRHALDRGADPAPAGPRRDRRCASDLCLRSHGIHPRLERKAVMCAESGEAYDAYSERTWQLMSR
jgi:hypothetical protein